MTKACTAPSTPTLPIASDRDAEMPIAQMEAPALTEPARPHDLADNEDFDYITGTTVIRLSETEKLRQSVVRALVDQYGIDPRDMAADVPLHVTDPEGGRPRRRRVSLAVFEHGRPHEQEYIRRVVVTSARPRNNRASAKIRAYTHAHHQNDTAGEISALMQAAGPACRYGLWTDGDDLIFIGRDTTSAGNETFLPLTNWPTAAAHQRDIAPAPPSRTTGSTPANETMLRLTFRHCRNAIHVNEGQPQDTAFWQFLYVLLTKFHDEDLVREGKREPRFYLHRDTSDRVPGEADRSTAAERVRELFGEVKERYAHYNLFDQTDELSLSDQALGFLVGELAAHSLCTTPLDTLTTAYHELFGDTLSGDHGQYFTPASVVRLLVEITAPEPGETVLDPCCGTGGFVRESLAALSRKQAVEAALLTTQEHARLAAAHHEELSRNAQERVFGADLDPMMARAAAFAVMMLTGSVGNTFHMDSLAFPTSGALPGLPDARRHLDRIGPGAVDVLLTNPPFGSDISVTGPVLELFRTGPSQVERPSVAFSWTREKDGTLRRGKPASSVVPEKLFVQKAIEWVRPGGRIGMVLPNGILSNPGADDEALRQYILDECWIMASVDLPGESFLVGAGVNVLTSALALRKKTEQEKRRERMHGPADYPMFMAVAEKVGHDRRGKPLYMRDGHGNLVASGHKETDLITVRGVANLRTVRRRAFILDDDLRSARQFPQGNDRPCIIAAYDAFVARHGHEFPWNSGD